MTIVPILIIAAISGSASLLVRGNRPWSTGIAILGLVGMVATSIALGATATIEIGGTTLAASDWLRLYAILGSVVGLLLVLVDVSALHEADAPGVIVLGLGAAVLALALPDPVIAVAAATAGGLAGVLVAAPVGAAARAAFVGVRELRALAVAGSLAIVATAWLARPLADLATAPAVFGLAYLAFAVAVAIRFGAIPFHLWAARVADAAPGVALPLLMAWGPAAFAAVALVWIDHSVAPLLLPFDGERAVVAGVGAVSIVLGLVAAWIQDDLEHVVGYTIVADAGFVVLGLTVFEPGIWAPTRTWLLVFVVVRSALAALMVALNGSFGTRRLSELDGWARRAPALAVALVGIAIATIGWPGQLAWDARASIAGLALPDPLATLVTIAPIGGLAVYGRILAAGVRPSGDAVRAGRSERPGWPVPWPARPMVGRGSIELGFERVGHAVGGLLDVLWTLPAAARLNRMGLAALAVLALTGLSLGVAAGGLDVAAAARAVTVVGEPIPSSGPARSGAPVGSATPGLSPTPEVTFEPIGSAPAGQPVGSVEP